MKYIKTLFIVLSLFTLMNCSNKPASVSYSGLTLPSDSVYNEIINAIFVDKDTFYMTRNTRKELEYLQSDLVKIKIKFHRKQDPPEPPVTPIYNTSIFELIYYGISNLKHLKADSLYFAFQNDGDNHCRISGNYNYFINLTKTELDAKFSSQKQASYLRITIPILNGIQTKAFVRIEAHCGTLCGEGLLYILEKTNNKWAVKRIIREWIS